jgi:hypothetical protein
MKTSELTGHALNWAVAQAEGDRVYRPRLGRPDDSQTGQTIGGWCVCRTRHSLTSWTGHTTQAVAGGKAVRLLSVRS